MIILQTCAFSSFVIRTPGPRTTRATCSTAASASLESARFPNAFFLKSTRLSLYRSIAGSTFSNASAHPSAAHVARSVPTGSTSRSEKRTSAARALLFSFSVRRSPAPPPASPPCLPGTPGAAPALVQDELLHVQHGGLLQVTLPVIRVRHVRGGLEHLERVSVDEHERAGNRRRMSRTRAVWTGDFSNRRLCAPPAAYCVFFRNRTNARLHRSKSSGWAGSPSPSRRRARGEKKP